MMPRRGKKNLSQSEFDPDDAKRVRHTKLGVWDLYEEITPQIQHIPGSSKIEQYGEVIQAFPYVWRMFKDLGTLKDYQLRLILLLAVQTVAALIPAVALWYSGQLLIIVERAVETRTVDTHLLARIAMGHIVCAVLRRSLDYAIDRIRRPLIRTISNFYSTHLFRVYARLDYATFEDPVVMQQLNQASGGRYSVAWEMVNSVIVIATSTLRLGTQFSVLAGIIYGQQDGLLFCGLSLLGPMLQIIPYTTFGLHGVWAATCRNEDYVRSVGLKNTVRERNHRQEIVAGGIADHLVSEYHVAQKKAGLNATPFFDAYNDYLSRDRLGSLAMLSESLSELPLIAFALRAPLYPAAIPVSLTSLQLIRSTVSKFQMDVISFVHQFGSVTDRLDHIRKLYQIVDIPNKIADGHIPFPENQQKLSNGVSLEFRNVSFKYPGSEDYALRNISFKLTEGQLCVIVGKNGSGKSTILKLVSRLYDPVEGEILIDGYDIRSLKLADLRKAIAVLFQDYSHFPLSIKENIGLGDPASAHDQDKIETAAKLGGAYEFIEKLPEGFDTYLERPVQDVYGNLPEGTKTIFGKEVSYKSFRHGGGFAPTTKSHLSGGQMQRLAVSRTFMRTLRSEGDVGMLLFDEPSASLDPTAEHELFERLRALRGGKTMIFSSHRFGNLTRHADVIIYMDDSLLREIGTHKELLEQKGDYARIYSLQAQAFMP